MSFTVSVLGAELHSPAKGKEPDFLGFAQKPEVQTLS